LKECIETLKEVEIDSTVAEISAADPYVNSRKIVYYRNHKHRIYTVFENFPEDLKVLQALNMVLISEIPKATLVKIPYPKPGLKTDLNVVKLGDLTEITKVISEIIFLLRIKQDIDYENSSYKGYSKVMSWIIKLMKLFSTDKKTVHVTLAPKDHEFLMNELNTGGETIAYKAFQQTINLLCMISSLNSNSEINKQLKAMTHEKNSMYKLEKSVNDVTNIEPYYIWLSVLSPSERGLLVNKSGRNFFTEQNKLMRQFRSIQPLDAEKKLHELKKDVDDRLPQGVKATIYGRLKFYNALKSEPEIKKLISSKKETKQLSLKEVLGYAKERSALSLFAEENIVATTLGIVSKPTEIMDLTRMIKLNRDTGVTFYYKQDIESCLTIKNSRTRVQQDGNNCREATFLSFLEPRTIQFVPGDKRL